MPCRIPTREEHSEAIRAAIGEGLRALHGLARQQRVPRDIRRSLDHLEDIERKIEPPRPVGSSDAEAGGQADINRCFPRVKPRRKS
jgi:hypothetical protein